MFQVRFVTTRAAAKCRQVACPPPDLYCSLPLKLAGRLNSSSYCSSSSSKCKVGVDDPAKHIGEIIAQQINVPEWANVIISKNGYMNFYLNVNTVEGGFERADSAMRVDKRGELTTAAESIVVSYIQPSFLLHGARISGHLLHVNAIDPPPSTCLPPDSNFFCFC